AYSHRPRMSWIAALVGVAAAARDDVRDIDAGDQEVGGAIAVDVADGERVEPELMAGDRAGERPDHVAVLARVQVDLAAARCAGAGVEAREQEVGVVVVVDVAHAAADAEAVARGL